MHYVRRWWPSGLELEFYGVVELQTDRHQWWWYGTWYSRVLPSGVRAGIPYNTPNLEQIGGAEFELARQHGWSLGRAQQLTDEEARRVIELESAPNDDRPGAR